MKISYLLNENEKIVLYTDQRYCGADVPDEYLQRPSTPIPVAKLYGYEPDDKMNDIHSANKVIDLAVAMKSGDAIPPVVVRKTAQGYQVLDGHHRMFAAKKAGLDTLDAVVVDAGDIVYSDEVKTEGKFAKAAGAAALAGACVAGTPGCATMDTKDALKTIHTVGRTAQTVQSMGRAGAEEELIGILKNKLRNIKDGKYDESIYTDLKNKFGPIVFKADYDKAAEYLHKELVKISRGRRELPHGLGYYAQQIAKELEGIDYRTLIDVYKDQYGMEGLAESLDQPYKLKPTSYLYSSGKWDVKAYSDTHEMVFKANRQAGEKPGPGSHWTYEFGTRPIHKSGFLDYDKTGEGDAQRILATAVAALKAFVDEVEPGAITFTADKGDDGTSRTKLYQRMVQRLAPQMGFKPIVQKGDAMDTFTLVRKDAVT